MKVEILYVHTTFSRNVASSENQTIKFRKLAFLEANKAEKFGNLLYRV